MWTSMSNEEWQLQWYLNVVNHEQFSRLTPLSWHHNENKGMKGETSHTTPRVARFSDRGSRSNCVNLWVIPIKWFFLFLKIATYHIRIKSRAH